MPSDSAVGACSVGGAIVVGTGIEQSGPVKPNSQKQRFVLVHTYGKTGGSGVGFISGKQVRELGIKKEAER